MLFVSLQTHSFFTIIGLIVADLPLFGCLVLQKFKTSLNDQTGILRLGFGGSNSWSSSCNRFETWAKTATLESIIEPITEDIFLCGWNLLFNYV